MRNLCTVDGQVSKVDKSGDCWLWIASKDKDGYGQITVGGKVKKAHRLVVEMDGSDVPSGMCVLHHCDTPSCVRLDHLYIGTMADNVRDRDNRKRRAPPKGEKNGRAKLTRCDVYHIRRSYKKGWTQKMIADAFGVHNTTISNILNGRSWT